MIKIKQESSILLMGLSPEKLNFWYIFNIYSDRGMSINPKCYIRISPGSQKCTDSFPVPLCIT